MIWQPGRLDVYQPPFPFPYHVACLGGLSVDAKTDFAVSANGGCLLHVLKRLGSIYLPHVFFMVLP